MTAEPEFLCDDLPGVHPDRAYQPDPAQALDALPHWMLCSKRALETSMKPDKKKQAGKDTVWRKIS